MKVVITGGAGFLGQRLAHALAAQEPGLTRLVLADRAPADTAADARIVSMVGDIADADFVRPLVADADVIFHLAAVVSSEAEADFDLGLRVNIDASRLLLDLCRETARRPRVIFTSSVAVFGPHGGGPRIDDTSAVDPHSSYGTEKAVAELLLREYSRRGFVDGLVLRLPTISIRPGRPNRAASSFASGIIREPLAGLPSVCPVPLDTRLWLLSPGAAIDALVHAYRLDRSSLAGNPIINLPGISVTVADMLADLEAAGGAGARALVTESPDPAVQEIVASWPAEWDCTRALALGFAGDRDFRSIIDAFIAEGAESARAC